jgi:hypothetical protein
MKLGDIYAKAEAVLQPNMPLMILIGAIIIGVTAWLMWRGNAIALAAWLVYMLSP